MKRFLLVSAILLGNIFFLFSQITEVNKGYEKGRMRGNYKIGPWQYYDSTGTLELEVDYTERALLFLRKDTSDFVIFKDGKWITSKVDIPPRYIGSSVDFYTILNENVDYPMQAWYRDVVGKVCISFVVDTNGRATDYEVVKDIGGECAWEFERVLHLVPNFWLVAEKDGQRYPSRFIISCEFAIIMDGKRLPERQPRKKRNKPDSIAYPLAKELQGISYTIKKGYNPE